MTRARTICASLIAAAAPLACSGASPGEDVGATAQALESGEYVSTAHDLSDAPYIGDAKHEEGYVLGYLLSGARVYAQVVDDDSVYGLIVDSHYGAWDDGHHCGWVSLSGLHGSGAYASASSTCPDPDDDFNNTVEDPPAGLFLPGSVIPQPGVTVIKAAVVLPTCPDFTVYANYDPHTHTFHDPAGVEAPGRGTRPAPKESCGTYAGVSEQKVTSGYCGFGTRFVTADDVAVEIKDTRRGDDVTPFGFMHSECVAGEGVPNPSPPPVTSGALEPGQILYPGDVLSSKNASYTLDLQITDGSLVESFTGNSTGPRPSPETLWDSTKARPEEFLIMQKDGDLVLYASAGKPLWSSGTGGHPHAYLAIEDDGTLEIHGPSSGDVIKTL